MTKIKNFKKRRIPFKVVCASIQSQQFHLSSIFGFGWHLTFIEKNIFMLMRISSNEFCCSFRIYASTCSAMAWLRLKLFFNNSWFSIFAPLSFVCIKAIRDRNGKLYFWFEWCFSPFQRHHYGSKKSTLAFLGKLKLVTVCWMCLCVWMDLQKRSDFYKNGAFNKLLWKFSCRFEMSRACQHHTYISFLYMHMKTAYSMLQTRA